MKLSEAIEAGLGRGFADHRYLRIALSNPARALRSLASKGELVDATSVDIFSRGLARISSGGGARFQKDRIDVGNWGII